MHYYNEQIWNMIARTAGANTRNGSKLPGSTRSYCYQRPITRHHSMPAVSVMTTFMVVTTRFRA